MRNPIRNRGGTPLALSTSSCARDETEHKEHHGLCRMLQQTAAHATAFIMLCFLILFPPSPLQLPAVAAAPPSVERLVAAEPSAEALATLRKGFTSAAEGFDSTADTLLTQSIDEWQRLKQPPDETAGLYKTRGIVRKRQGNLEAALTDFTEALRLAQLPNSKPDPSEIQRTYVQRAGTNEALKRWKGAEEDFSKAIEGLDQLDAIEATNPYLFVSRSHARSNLNDFAGAAEDSLRAENDFKLIGQKISRITSSADTALALYGSDQIPEAVEKMRFVFKNKGKPASNNPDDIPLLQELSRKDAELHLAYAAHLFGAGKQTDAETQWESGCIRIEAYVQDGTSRLKEEKELREADAKKADETGKLQSQRASSVASQLSNSDIGARLSGLDPQSPYVTQRPQTGYFWYKTGQGEIERRDPGFALAEIDPLFSCVKFRSEDWLEKNRPEWPPNLRAAVKRYTDKVPQKAIVLPPKGSPPSRGEVEF